LPGTVGSYYSQNVAALNTTISTLGFTIEAWVNYASFANAAGDAGSSRYYPFMLSKMFSNNNPADWLFGATTGGALSFYVNNTTPVAYPTVYTANNIIQTGQWTHVMVQCNGSNVYCAVNGTFQVLTGTYSPAGSGTIAPAVVTVPVINTNSPISIGQYNNSIGPNFTIAKARIVLGTTGTNGNVYSSGNFTPSPNFNQTLPSGATIAWQLDSQYPLPTYPSIQDVTPLALQSGSFGAVPTPIGGVTSNLFSPYSTTYPQLDSIRFDGTGYIDYGNAASSVLTTNIWASNWTIEGWVYATSVPCQLFERSNLASGFDFSSNVNASGQVNFYYGASTVGPTLATVPVNTWTHVAVTYDGVRSNIYVSSNTIGTANISTTVTGTQAFVPTYSTHFGYNSVAGNYLNGNLADVRVSNVARYSGTTYVVPTAPFSTDSSTLLLLKSLAGQVGTTLEVQGRGLGSTSIGAGRNIYSFPPAPMSSYLLDTTSNASVTYGQGKYVVSASSEYTGPPAPYPAWYSFDKNPANAWSENATAYSATSPYGYYGNFTTVDTLGNSYPGEWVQLQMPVSVLLSSYVIYGASSAAITVGQMPGKWWLLGSRDGINWTLVDARSGVSSWTALTASTFTVSATQAYNYYRIVVNQVNSPSGGSGYTAIGDWTLNGTEESLCITSDAKVGVGIANPQRALEVAGDLVVSGTISGGAGLGSFRNRIINGDMRIAQRGTSAVVTTPPTYTLDRWKTYLGSTGGVQTVTQQTLTASDTPYQYGFRYSQRTTMTVGPQGGVTTVDQNALQQVIEGYNVADLNWGTSFGAPVTISFWFRSNLSTGSLIPITLRTQPTPNTYVTTFTTTGSGTWQYVTATVPPPPNGVGFASSTSGALVLDIAVVSGSTGTTVNAWSAVNQPFAPGCTYWSAQAGNYIEITGVQLEKGTVATPFEFRNYAQELALCQRYYYQITQTASGAGQYPAIGTIHMRNTTLSAACITLPVNMRAQPTFSNTCVLQFDWDAVVGGPGNLTSPALQTTKSTNRELLLTATQVSTGTQGQAGALVMGAGAGTYVAFNAEL